MRRFALVPLLLPPLLNLCAAASRPAEPADEATVRGEPIVKEDFQHGTPRDKVLFDESRPGYWNLRYTTWGDNPLLHGHPEVPDITYDPALKGIYDIEVESRATDRPGGFGLKLASDSEFTILDVPNQGATVTNHFNVWVPFRKSVRLDGEKLVFRCIDIETCKGTLVVSWFTSLYFEQPTMMRPAWQHHSAKIGPEARKQWLGYWVRRSEDNGETWGVPCRTNVTAPHGPIPLKDGRLIYVGAGDGTAVEESRDDGITWQPIAKIPSPSSIVARVRTPPTALRTTSLPFLRQWPDLGLQHEITLTDAPDGDLGYPASTQLSDGSILTIYYQKDQPDEKTCLMGTHWRLPRQR